MGPTGAGKSSFIEALAGNSQQLSISKDQLAAYTQAVNGYRLVNIISTGGITRHPVYLIDTPGFSDSKISEVEIMNMVRKWLRDHDLRYVRGILFLTPITGTRLHGSQWRTIEMLRQYLEPRNDIKSVTFVTTMWDKVHSKRTKERAESNFAQLRDDVCKEFFGQSSVSITTFTNTKSSALEVMDLGWNVSVEFSSSNTSAFPNLYRDLHERIESALLEKQMIELDLAQSEAQTNADFKTIIEKNHIENHETLTRFIKQLINFGPLPLGYDQAAQCLRKAIAANITPTDPLLVDTFQQWAQEPNLLEEPVVDPKPSPSPEPLPRASEKLALKGVLRRLLNVSKDSGSKWFKRGHEVLAPTLARNILLSHSLSSLNT
ncbi:hypothetical protein BJ165DRAFT_1562331 [Panaeolus papilionaceus]|nr:hypothetical protein BJ165DRAFT_1562331 [Panaeolus papilionaceus]